MMRTVVPVSLGILMSLTLCLTAVSGAQDTGGAAKGVTSLAIPQQSGGAEKKSGLFRAQKGIVQNRVWGVVMANQRPVMGIPIEAGGFSPVLRAQLVAGRMARLYEQGAKFKDAQNYVVGSLNNEIVLGLRPGPDTDRVELLFTIDKNLYNLLAAHNKGARITQADIAFRWRDILIKALEGQDEITGKQDPDAWANIPAGYGKNQKVITLHEADVHR